MVALHVGATGPAEQGAPGAVQRRTPSRPAGCFLVPADACREVITLIARSWCERATPAPPTPVPADPAPSAHAAATS